MSLSERGRVTEGDVNTSGLRRQWQSHSLGSEAEALLTRDSDVFLHQNLSTPCLDVLRSAQGSWIEDLDGRRCLDFHGNMVHQVGHAHPRVVDAVKRQLDVMPFCPRRYTNHPAVELAENLASLAPGGLSRILFAPGGSAAMGIALKLARIATGRHKTISLWGSFHGASLDAVSVGGEEGFRRGVGPLMPGSEHAPPSDPLRCPLGCGDSCSMACASYLEYMLEQEGDVAAVVAEPIRCTTVASPPPGYWQRIRRACDRAGALLIFDEIPSCLGRTGRMFACEWHETAPDILVMGKGLGGGVLPLAAVAARPELNVARESSIGHFTHEKSPLSCAAGLAAIQVIEEEGLVERSRKLGEQALERLQTALAGHIVEARGRGLLIGIELEDPRLSERALYDCLSRGLSFKVSAGTVLTLAPPLNIAEGDLDRALDILESVLLGL